MPLLIPLRSLSGKDVLAVSANNDQENALIISLESFKQIKFRQLSV